MLFNSISFLVFFTIVVSAYYLLPHRSRWPMLLAASCYFYMSFVPVYILILAFTILVDYFSGILIAGSTGKTRTRWLTLSIISNLGVLAFFKYYGFLNDNFEAFMHGLGFSGYILPELGIILPIGLSFHTFQSLSYTIEVYYGRQKAERHFGIFSLYVMFFPQLVAGPIERPGNLLNQLHKKITFNASTVASGLRLMAWGFFKKLMIADHVAEIVNHVYDTPGEHTGPALILATFFFAIQIYCDFSGYTDIALGAARCLGIHLMVNFRTPYYSANVSEFWRRWHISLSTWFRDYLYIPLGGNRVVKWRWYYNLMITFVLSGLWHGAAWTFLLWGGLHGFYLIFAIVSQKWRDKIHHAIGMDRVPRLDHAVQVLITFILVDFAWIFFRANTVEDAFHIVGNLFTDLGSVLTPDPLNYWPALLGIGRQNMAIALLSIVVMEVVQRVDLRYGAPAWMAARAPWQRWVFYTGLVTSIILFGSYYHTTQFIYFQF